MPSIKPTLGKQEKSVRKSLSKKEKETAAKEQRSAEKALEEKTRLNQILLDAFPCVALLMRSRTREIIASNAAAMKVGAVPGAHCFSTWRQRQDPCPWCLAPALWSTGKAQHLEVEALGVFWDTFWIPASDDLYMHFAFDITARKKAEEALWESEARFRSYFELPLIGIAITSLKKEWIEVNDQICSMMGYSREELLRMTWPELTHPEDLAADVEQFNRILTGQIDSYSMDKRFIRKNGEVVWTSISVGCIRDSGGRVKHIVALGLDITERKRAEKEIQSLARFPSENPNPVLRIARDGTLLYVNKAGLILLPDENLQVGQAAPPILREAAFQAMDSGSTQMLDLECRRQVYSFSIAPIVGEGYANLYARNATDRRQAEETLRESEKHYRLLAETTQDLIYVIDRDHRVEYINASAERALGKQAKNVIGKAHADLFPPEISERHWHSLQKVFESGEPFSSESYIVFPHGEMWSSDKLVPFRRERGKVTAVMGVSRDVSEIRQTVEALRKSESRLRSLSAEIARVEESERHRLAIYLHDEIGQSLALLRMKLGSFATASKSKSDKHDIKVLRDLLETIIEQTHTLTFELSPPVLHQLGLEAAIEWAGEKISRDHGLDFTFNDDGMAKSLNPDLQAILFRCVRELMLNTVKHAKAKRLTVAIAREGEKILYTIADDGLGFDPSLHDARTEETGFGLLSVREHLATMGGNCRIQSTPGQGTRITLTVPVDPPAPEERDAACRMTDGSLIPENEP